MGQCERRCGESLLFEELGEIVDQDLGVVNAGWRAGRVLVCSLALR